MSLTPLEKKFDELADDVREIKKAIVGDSKWGTPGLIKEVASLTAWRNKMNLRIAFWSGTGATIVFLAKAGFEYITRK